MGSLVKKVITEMTFRDSESSAEYVKYLRLRMESEGAGRFLVLTDESDYDGKGHAIYFYHPDDIKMLYRAALEMWKQGTIYAEGEDE